MITTTRLITFLLLVQSSTLAMGAAAVKTNSIDQEDADTKRTMLRHRFLEQDMKPDSSVTAAANGDGFNLEDIAPVGFAASPSSGNDESDDNTTRNLASYTTNEYNMAAWVNWERTSRGLQPLYWSADLLDEAQRWADYMARTGNFRHRNPLSQNVDAGWRTLAENIANHYSVAYSGAHTSLMNSPGHRANILNADVNRIGVGVRQDSSGQYYISTTPIVYLL